MASKRPSQPAAANQPARRAITLELATETCPDAEIAEKIANHFGLEPVEYDSVRDDHRRAVEQMAAAFAGMPEENVPDPLRRVAGPSAPPSGPGSSTAGRPARPAASPRSSPTTTAPGTGTERPASAAGPDAAASRRTGSARAAAPSPEADDAVQADRQAAGLDWKPAVAAIDYTQTVDRRSAVAEISAFG